MASTFDGRSHQPHNRSLIEQGNCNMKLIIDNFAGGGGASTGIANALGRDPDIAINHDAAALDMHAVNHPTTRHFCENVWDIDPVAACQGKPVGFAWFSPDCTHFSRAKGGRPVRKDIRGLARVAVRWAVKVRPDVILLENVPEFLSWGPISNGQPIKALSGLNFSIYIKQLRALGYQVEWQVLRAHHYGAPTIRKRLFLVARCDGQPIVWPEASHGENKKAFKTAAECIDWSIPCPSIFTRKRPLAESTLKRIAKGLQKFVIDNPEPFVVEDCVPFISTYYSDKKASDVRGEKLDKPLHTVTTENRHALVTPIITKLRRNCDASSVNEPLHTITSGGNHHALTCAFLAKHYTGATGSQLTKPLGTVTSIDHHSLVSAVMVPIDNVGGKGVPVHPIDEPLRTITKENRHALVSAFLIKYYSQGDGQNITDPLHTVTSKGRFGLVTIRGEEYEIVDIGLRMLQPRELFNAQGFPAAYIIDHDSSGKRITKTKQVALCGNSVPPPVAEALVRANTPDMGISECVREVA